MHAPSLPTPLHSHDNEIQTFLEHLYIAASIFMQVMLFIIILSGSTISTLFHMSEFYPNKTSHKESLTRRSINVSRSLMY